MGSDSFVDSPKAATSTQHIVFDSFSLIENGVLRLPRPEERKLLFNLFQHTYAVAVGPLMVIIRVKALPPKPWPITVAGAPLYLTTSETDQPVTLGQMGGGAAALSEYNASNGSRSHTLTEMIKKGAEYLSSTKLKFSSMVYLGTLWIVSVQSGTKLESLPNKLCCLPCFYRDEKPSVRGQEAAPSRTQPTDIVRDESDYGKKLRPGVMLGNGSHSDELLTSSGVCVQDKQSGELLMIVASHGFPLGQESVYHPNKRGLEVGSVVKILDDSNISLARLHPGYAYENKPFGDDCGFSKPLTDFMAVDDIKLRDLIHINSPFMEFLEGQVVSVEFTTVPADNIGKWVFSNWLWFGNGAFPTDGYCGAPVINDDKVVCFFRFMGEDNIARAIAADIIAPYYELKKKA